MSLMTEDPSHRSIFGARNDALIRGESKANVRMPSSFFFLDSITRTKSNVRGGELKAPRLMTRKVAGTHNHIALPRV
jgi:hypothetical protein